LEEIEEYEKTLEVRGGVTERGKGDQEEKMMTFWL